MRMKPSASTPRDAAPSWLAGLVAFNEELRALFVGRTDAPPVAMRCVRDVVAAHFGITVAEIIGRNAARRHVWPRQVAMYICARETGLSSSCIARFFGDRDHTTALHAISKVAARVASDPTFSVTLSRLVARCRAGAPA
jgi:chromosomal replication initiation ATPase DnaA